MSDHVQIREVGPRDGLQMAKTILSSERKLEWIRAEAAAGVTEMETTSFVPPKVIPQFADARDVAVGAKAIPGLLSTTLVPNLRGAQTAFDLEVGKVNFVVSASEAHNLSNVRRTTDESVEDFRRIIAERDARGLKDKTIVTAVIATAFGCTIQGEVPEGRVVEVAGQLAEAGAAEVGIADTIGYANPTQVKRVVGKVRAEIGELPTSAHFHDTRGTGLANVVAAIEVGVRRFDASLGGLGGCPFAPGATGNINTEDCAYMLESMGMKTGIDIEALLVLREKIEPWLPNERFTGGVYRSGLPKTYRSVA